MSFDWPTSMPILQRVPCRGGEIGIVTIDELDHAWTLEVTFVNELLGHHTDSSWSAFDDAGVIYSGQGAGGGSQAYRCNFEPGLDSAARIVTVDLRFGEVAAQLEVPLLRARALGTARILRVESWPSDRWSQEWRPVERQHVAALFQGFERRLLPDEIVPLNAVAGEVAGRDLVFLSAERWGRTWLLRHHAVRDTPTYSPLWCHWLECEFDRDVVAAPLVGGGTAGRGSTFAHMFLADEFPAPMIVRRPAIDGGPPLLEVELKATPGAG